MPGLRAFSIVHTEDQWIRAAHRGTFLDPRNSGIELAWSVPDATDAPGEPPPLGAGLAFDAACRLYRSMPEQGQIERSLWRAGDPLAPAARQPTPVGLFEAEEAPVLGDFAPATSAGQALHEPRGVAVDEDDRLFVAEAGTRTILVYDLWSGRLLRHAVLPAGARPLDLAAHGRTVWAVADRPAALLLLTARDGPTPVPLPDGVEAPARIAISPRGEPLLLERAGAEDARVVPLQRPEEAFTVPRATDIGFETEDTLVAARHAGEDFLRFRLAPGSRVLLAPLVARGYRGDGIVRTPDGRIGFRTERGFRNAVAVRLRYAASGEVTVFRLDSGEYQSVWGRLFIDACIPSGTSVEAHCIATDDEFDEPTLPRTPPGNVEAASIPRPDLSPPMPPLGILPLTVRWRPLHRRESGRELAWAQPEPEEDPFVTYEAPVMAQPGRFLWVTLRLRGNTRLTPRVKSLRVEHRSHDYLRRLPRTFSREEEQASFLRRYLAIAEGLIGELDARAALRHALVDPYATPEEMLPWLASFLGLVLDERWPLPARRTLIAEVAWLFRFRGTVPGLTRFLQIYLGVPVVLIEQFRLRGIGGAIIGEAVPAASRAVLGAGFRIGGALGDPAESPLEGTVDDAFRTHAHRFSVIIPGVLSAEQLDVVGHVLDVHRPAHTIFEICTAGTGMRVGRGLHVGLSSIIGRSGGFATLQLGAAALGRGGIVGRPEPGTRPGASRLGGDSRVG